VTGVLILLSISISVSEGETLSTSLIPGQTVSSLDKLRNFLEYA
jgi:hypothetical protein